MRLLSVLIKHNPPPARITHIREPPHRFDIHPSFCRPEILHNLPILCLSLSLLNPQLLEKHIGGVVQSRSIPCQDTLFLHEQAIEHGLHGLGARCTVSSLDYGAQERHLGDLVCFEQRADLAADGVACVENWEGVVVIVGIKEEIGYVEDVGV